MVSFNIDVRRSSASSLMSVLLTMSLILLALLREMHMWGWILGTDCRSIKQLLSLFRLERCVVLEMFAIRCLQVGRGEAYSNVINHFFWRSIL